MILLIPRDVEASGACTSARFHDWNNMGCNQNYAGAGGPPSGQTGAGGNQSHCAGGCGMPRWWVSEPYENLWLSDKPLNYNTSSGQEMSFQWYYRQRYKVPDPDEVPDYYLIGAIPRYVYNPDYFAPVGLASRTQGMTNAAWSHNWMMSISVWDSQWESENGIGNYQSTHPVFSDGYEAFVFRPEGGVEYFYNTNGQSSLQDPRSQVQLQPLAAAGYPVVGVPTPDTNGIFWGNSTNGFHLVYPDGSQDVFGLTYYDAPLVSPPYQPTPTITTAEALLTARIDPQGRITRVGYEQLTGTRDLRVKYVVDSDGRTNTFLYSTNYEAYGGLNVPIHPWNLQEVDDPYGRKVQFGYDFVSGVLTSITDAAGMTSSFQYQAPTVTNTYYLLPSYTPTNIVGLNGTNNCGWITNLSTPYGNTSFSYYQLLDSTATEPDAYIQRAIYISEPTGAHQLYYYLHNNTSAASTNTAPTVSGQAFDDGNSGTYDPALTHRNTFYWGRRQFAALSSTVQSTISGSLSNALADLTTADFNKADLKHWLLSSVDDLSITEGLSSEQDPSPDAAGSIPGLRTWYNYSNKPSGQPELLGSDPQVSCIARVLPDGTSQYTTYNFYQSGPATGLVSDNESSYSKPDGTIGVLTNWFAYAANGVDLVGVNNSAGQYVNYGYNGSHQITSITNAMNQVATLSWNPNLTGVQWPGGQSVSLNYGSADYGRLQTISWSPSGRSFTINSYSSGLPASVTDDRGVTLNNSWDNLNRFTSAAFPDGTTISNIYTFLDLGATKDRLGNWTHYSYDGLEHLTTVTNANNAVTTYSWCGCGSLTAILDALTNLTSLNYDNQGNLTNVVFPDYSSISWQFDLAGRMTNAFDGAGRSIQLSYNNQGLATAIAGSYGALQSVVYDAINRPVSITDANGVTVTNTFDAINELLTRTWPDGVSEGYGYSAAGLIAYTNRDGQPTHFGLDAAGRVTSVTNANHEIIQLGYDSLDDVISLVDGLNHTTSWQYNQYGWLTNKVDGLNRNAFRFAYNANGWLTNRWTPEKGDTGYSFDNVGNLKTITYPSSTINYLYNADNWLINMADSVGTTVFSYTSAGQLQSESNSWAAVSYTYSQGLRTAMSIGSWGQTYNYDSIWRITSVVSPAGAFGYSYNFNPASSLVTGISLPNGANIVNSFDGLARLTQTALNNQWGHTLDGYSYSPDALGLRTNIVRNLGLTSSSVAVGYDNIGQLTSWVAKESGGTSRLNEQLGFGFDAADNLHSRTSGNLSQTFNVDAANELTSVTRTGTFTESGATPAPAASLTVNGQVAQTYGDFTFARTNLTLVNGNNTFTNVAVNPYGVTITNTFTVNLPSSVSLNFDNNGSFTNDGARVFGYDSENQLTNVMVAGQWRSSFVYDGLNRRRIARDYSWNGSAWVETNEVRYVYDGYLVVQERDTNNNPLVTYTRGLDLSGDLRSAGGIGGLLARTDGNGSTFYHADGIGNITALMDGNENIAARYLYGSFGKLVGQWGSMANANEMQLSSMQQHDGLTLYPFRSYEPNFQRFLNQDPIQEAGGINLYRAMNNNPLRYVDPLGLEGNPIMGLGGAWNSDPFGRGGTFYGPGLFPRPLDTDVANEMQIMSDDMAIAGEFFNYLNGNTEEQLEADAQFHKAHPYLAWWGDAMMFGASMEMGKGEAPCPRMVNPSKLRLPPTRPSGADPFKLADQIRKYGTSTKSMPPILVTEGANGVMMINNGVTRATRAAMYGQNQIPVEVFELNPALKFENLPTVGSKLPGQP